ACRLAPPEAAPASPARSGRWVRASRGEFSAAKPAYVKARPGWVSDRTVCYLATGRPWGGQGQGAGGHRPPSRGPRFFPPADEAAPALRAVEADYPVAARAARALAEEVFAA